MGYAPFSADSLELDKAMVEELHGMLAQHHQWKARHALRTQERVMKARGTPEVRKDALCVPDVEIPAYVYHVFGQKFGYEIWEDPDFVNYVDREIKIRVQARVRDASVLMRQPAGAIAAAPAASAAPRFHKSYG
jgi:hypothetical protein